MAKVSFIDRKLALGQPPPCPMCGAIWTAAEDGDSWEHECAAISADPTIAEARAWFRWMKTRRLTPPPASFDG